MSVFVGGRSDGIGIYGEWFERNHQRCNASPAVASVCWHQGVGVPVSFIHLPPQHTQMEPALMAYDRPSAKFLAFLAKHYCLTQSVPQVPVCE